MLHNEEFETSALLYAYGELGAAEEPAFLEHLKNCRECQGIIRTCVLARASFEDIKAPRQLSTLPLAVKRLSLPDYITPLFNIRRLAPAGAVAALAVVLAFVAVKYGSVNPQTESFVDSMHAEITDIEASLDNILTDFESMKQNNMYLQEEE
jgi:hypothetical protein